MNLNITFVSPRDIKKGEIISFKELFNSNENKIKLEDALESEIKKRIDIIKLENEKKKEIYLNKVKTELEKKLEDRKKELESIFKEKIEVTINSKENEFKNKEFEFKSELNKKESELLKITSKLESELKSKESELLNIKSQWESEKKAIESDWKSKLISQESELNEDRKVALTKLEIFQQTVIDYKNIIENMEKNYNKNLEEKLLKEREIFEKEKNQIIKEYEDKKKSASTIGDNAEEEIRNKLISIFPNDIVKKPNHSLGEADIMHSIVEDNKKYSEIYYEIKNRKSWSKSDYENFANKVRKSNHDFNIYIAQSLPKKQLEQHIVQFDEELFFDSVNNIYLTSFNNWLPVIAVIRRQSILLKKSEQNNKSKEEIKDKIYKFFNSSEFKNYFQRLVKNFSEIEDAFKNIQKKTIEGIAINNKASLEIQNLQSNIDSKLNV